MSPCINKRTLMSCNMKVLDIIMSALVMQTSASFFDEFRGAVSSVESSFGKLLSDVIYDVKETIDCTLMAVEQVLALGVYGDPADYDRRCGGGTKAIEQPVVATEPPPLPQTPQTLSIPLTKMEGRQVDSPIQNVDHCDVLKKGDAYAQLGKVKLTLKNKTERLNEISELLKKQLGFLSAEVQKKFKAIETQKSEPSVDSIWNDIELLHEIEHKHENTDEAKNISRVLDQILNILDTNEEDPSTADDYKVQEIMRKLGKQSKGRDSDIRKDDKDYPKDFRDYAKMVFGQNKAPSPSDDTTKKLKSDEMNNVGINKKKDKDDKNKTGNNNDKTKEVTTVKPKRKKPARATTTTTEKPLSIEELAAQYGSLFNVISDIDSVETKKAVESANHIIEDNKLNDAIMNSLAEIDSSKEARNLFDDPDFIVK